VTSYSWAKLWIDVLDDHKVGMLSDHLWRRFFEFVLLAKEHDQDGFLPPIPAMAWRLRASPEAIEAALEELAQATGGEAGPGLVQRVEVEDAPQEYCWHVTNFVKRQERPMSDAERKARQRARDKRSHAPVTPCDTDQDQEADQDQDTESDQDQQHPPAAEPVDNSPQRPVEEEDREASRGTRDVLLDELLEAGMAEKGARRVLMECDRARIEGWLCYVNSSNGRIQNPGGYLWHILAETDERAPRVRAPPDPDSSQARRRYIEGEYADLIRH